MLSQETENRIAEYIADRINALNTRILERIGNNIDMISKLSPSDAYTVGQLLKYGGSYNELLKEIARISGLSIEDVNTIFERIAKENKDFAKQFYKYRKMDFVPYDKDIPLQNQVASISRLTNELFKNISNTSTIGYAFKDLNGNLTFSNIQETYQKLIDESILAVTQGKETFASTMRNTIKSLGGSGLVVYESGRTRRLDSAVRMNILDGIRQLNMENSQRFGQEYGADGVEISVHENPAPDHADIQGRQFKQEEFDKLENGEQAEDVNGAIYDGADKRQIGHYNCYHKTFAIIVGVSEPEYTDEQLQEIKQKNEDGFEFEGKHYTMYEGTQLQRRIETEIRKQKDTQILARASGEAGKDIAEESQKKINQLTSKYNDLCQKSGLPSKKERMSISGYRKIKVIEKPVEEIKYEEGYDSIYGLEKQSNEWWNNLDRDNQKAIYRYTGGLNVDINEYLNGNINLIDENMLPVVEQNISLIDEGLAKFKLNKNIITYRKASSRDIFGTGSRINGNEVSKYKNSIITNKGYTSTSLSAQQADNFRGDTFITFRIPKNTKGAYLGDHSNIPSEQEFLIARDSKYIINNIYAKKGKIYIDATMLE